MNPKLSLSDSQHKFITMPNKFRAYVGGFGSGKTFSGCLDLALFASKYPGIKQGYFAPTYPLIRDIFYGTMEEAWDLLGQSIGRTFTVEIIDSKKEVHLFAGKELYGTIICRTMDNPKNIVGFKIARALVDEIDVMDATKAEQAWNKIIARMRLKIPGVVNGIGVTTTPEGFKFVYDRFKKNPKASYGMVQASTYENLQYLPDDYISSLHESYPPQLVSAYIMGDFVNLTSGTVYPQFDRKLNHCDDEHDGIEPLHIGMDFNVGKMSAIAHIKKDGEPRAVAEILGAYDTPDMIKQIKRRFWKETSATEFEKTCDIYVYPDASGGSRKTVDAGTSDLALLSDAGFIVMSESKNPPVRDRINSVNAMFCNANNERRYMVNTRACPLYTEAREQQVYNKQGEPDKAHDRDHPNDAADYFIFYEYQLNKPTSGILLRRRRR
ncbi:MAG: hypothetical protein [Bacteriophage sp.]|nr:MAG: hypothetical protein [Bacteriophage sp.]